MTDQPDNKLSFDSDGSINNSSRSKTPNFDKSADLIYKSAPNFKQNLHIETSLEHKEIEM